jgi:type I restriction enzyme M protein
MLEKYLSLEPRFRRAYDLLFEKFGDLEFTFPDAEGVLQDYANKKEVLSELEKAGLLRTKPSSEDRRRKIYRLLPVNGQSSPQKDSLISLLKAGADLIRTRVDYRVLPVLLFFKAISDKYMVKVREYLSQGKKEEDAYTLANYDILKLYDTESKTLYSWHNLVNNSSEFINGLNKIAELNRDELKNLSSLIEKTGLPSLFRTENRHIVEKLLELFGRFEFSEVSYDILGDAYEWILYYFAPTKAKEGEVYTPLEVSRLLAHLVEPENEEIILDPACGSASMLIEQYLYLQKDKGISSPSVYLVGQEVNDMTGVLAELNFVLHGIKDYEIHIGSDSLVNPRFEHADRVVINPPWNQDGYDEGTLKGNKAHGKIFTFGYTNKQSADWAWIQLVNHYAKKKAGIVIDSGALFRGGKEQSIRRQFVEEDLIDAVILLPEKIFYNTQAPGVIIVLNKDKPKERKGKIIFINASNEYIPHPDVKKLNKLSEENIKKIARVYREFRDENGFARVVDKEEVSKKNDYNLNVSLYVSPEIEDEEIDLIEEFKQLKNLHREYLEKYELVRGYIEELRRLEG